MDLDWRLGFALLSILFHLLSAAPGYTSYTSSCIELAASADFVRMYLFDEEISNTLISFGAKKSEGFQGRNRTGQRGWLALMTVTTGTNEG